MAIDPITEYQTATENFERARNKAEQMVRAITDAANTLRNWQAVTVSNVNISFPAGLVAARSINAKEWPTAEQLAQVLSSYHSTLHEAGNAYRRVPENQRKVVQPPPSR